MCELLVSVCMCGVWGRLAKCLCVRLVYRGSQAAIFPVCESQRALPVTHKDIIFDLTVHNLYYS